MKKYLSLILILFCFAAHSQTQPPYQDVSGYGTKEKKKIVTDALHIPTFCGVPSLNGSVATNRAAIAIDSCNHLFYFYDPKLSVWSVISGGSGGSGGGGDSIISLAKNLTDDSIILITNHARFSVYDRETDTTSLSQRINEKADSSQQALRDTAANIRGDFPVFAAAAASHIYIDSAHNSFNPKPFYPSYSGSDTILNFRNTRYGTGFSNTVDPADSTIVVNYSGTATARSALSLTTAGTTGPASYNSTTGAINVPDYSGAGYITDTTNKWVNNVTKINDSTVRIFKGSGSTDLLIRGNGSGGGGITMVKQIHASGGTVTVNNASTWLIDKSASNVTITLAAAPVDGQRLDISFKLAVTAVTVSPNSGQTIMDANGVTSVDAGESIAYQYDSTDLIWYRF